LPTVETTSLVLWRFSQMFDLGIVISSVKKN
jgi:hypothetical protein